MCSRLRHHPSCLIKIIIAVKGRPIHCQSIYISHLRRGRKFSKIVYHIVSVKRILCRLSRFICPHTGKLADLYHMRACRQIASVRIMIIKTIQYSAVYFHFVKIMNRYRCILASVFFEAVKTVAFHKVSAGPIPDRLNLCFFCY